MADHTGIEWTDATWNPITGCSVYSPGCERCYAMGLAHGRLRNHPSRAGLTNRHGKWSGEVRLNGYWLTQPRRWTRPRRIFVCAHGDLFHERVPDAWIDIVMAEMATAKQHIYQVLTKRADRMRDYLTRLTTRDSYPWPHVWLGVSVEDQQRADERVPVLLETPAAVRFVSAEPLLGLVDLTAIRRFNPSGRPWINALNGIVTRGQYLPRSESECGIGISSRIPGELPALDWVIVGGESGSGARPMHPDWARRIRDDCEAAGVAFHFKQWGEWAPTTMEARLTARLDGHLRMGDTIVLDGEKLSRLGKRAAGRNLDGRTWDGMPEVRT